MSNATIDRPLAVAPRGRGGIWFGVAAVAVALLVVMTVMASGVFAPGNVGTADPASLSRAQQASADRLTGLAEADSLAAILRRQEAEAARWQALADYYQFWTQANRAAADRLTGLAGHGGSAGLTRAQQAESERLAGLAQFHESNAP